jgi:hypothetical protein
MHQFFVTLTTIGGILILAVRGAKALAMTRQAFDNAPVGCPFILGTTS